MTYEMYHNVFMICSVSAGVMGLVTILLFFLLRIPAVIGELTGVTARKGIEEIRNSNVKSGHPKRDPKRKRRRQKEETDLLAYGMMQSENQQMGTAILAQNQQMGTAVLAQNQQMGTAILPQNQQMGTAVLAQDQQLGTAVLAQNQGIERLGGNQQMETALFQNQEYETSLLEAEFEILQDITIVHTEESVSDMGHP